MGELKEIVDVLEPVLKFDRFYQSSLTEAGGIVLFMIRKNGKKLLVAVKKNAASDMERFEGEMCVYGEYDVKICPLTPGNASILREMCPFIVPSPVGKNSAFGLGDRLGNATPGHIRAVSKFDVVPVFAQQSVREMSRTERTPQQVMDDVTWAVFREHYTGLFGADADHLKTEKDIRKGFEAGFTMFTTDPSDHINNLADTLSIGKLEEAFNDLFENNGEKQGLMDTYLKGKFPLQMSFSEEEVKREAVKYLPAIRHVLRMYEYLLNLEGSREFDFEVSVDETELPTSPRAHLFIITQLSKNGVKITGLAPRFAGEFQKAIDYIGDVGKFKEELRQHVVIAGEFGSYKISIHSGSDKFSIFPVVGEVAEGLFHEKTAGTSYVEAMRVIAEKAPELYREIHKFGLRRFKEDRASYHVTTDLSVIPDVDKLADSELVKLLNENNSRQLIHITYGSVLQAKDENDKFRFRGRIMEVLDINEEEYFKVLDEHFSRHMKCLGLKEKTVQDAGSFEKN